MKIKRFLSVIVALLIILVYVPGAAANNGEGDNWIHVHLDGQAADLGQDVCGYAYFDATKFGECFDPASFCNLKPLAAADNPFAGMPGINATHVIALEKQGDMVQCHDSGLFVSDALVGIMLTAAGGSDQIRAASMSDTGPAGPMFFTRDHMRFVNEAQGTLNIHLLPGFRFPAKLTLTKSADPVHESTAKPGDIVTYSIDVKNISPMCFGSTAYAVNVSDMIPFGTSFVPGSVTLGGNPYPDVFLMTGLNVFVGNLWPQQMQTVSFQVKINDLPDFLDSGKIFNIAVATGLDCGKMIRTMSNLVEHTIIEPKIEIGGSKIWDDYENVHENRPEGIIINLFRSLEEENGQEDDDLIELTEAEMPYRTQTIYGDWDSNEWDFLFEDLPEFDSEGHRYVYRVEEAYLEGDEGAAELYATTYDGFDIINDYLGVPNIEVIKTVANLTTDGPRGESADIEIGETAGYEVTIRNIGDLTIHHVILRDAMVEIGQEATDQDDNDYIFEDDGEGVACLHFYDMMPEDEITLSYQYTATEDDVDISPITNTAIINAFIYNMNMMPRAMAVNGEINDDIEVIEPPIVWSTIVEDSAEINVTEPPEETTGETSTTGATSSTGTTSSATSATIEVTTSSLPLASIKPISSSVPLASVSVVQTQIPQSGESAPLWPIGLALLAIAAGMGLIIRKSKNQTETEDDK